MVPHVFTEDRMQREKLFSKLIEIPGAKKCISGKFRVFFGGVIIDIQRHKDTGIRVESGVLRFSALSLFGFSKRMDQIQTSSVDTIKSFHELGNKYSIPIRVQYIDWRPRFWRTALIIICILFMGTSLLLYFLKISP